MTIEELLKIYPTGKICKEATFISDEELSFIVEDCIFVLAKSEISQTENQLLQKLFPQTQPTCSLEKHPWYGYLFKNQPIDVEGSVRVIQFELKKPKAFLQTEWHNSIKEFFPQLADFFFIDDMHGLIIEKAAADHYTLEELQSIFLTLDADFATSTLAFIGNFFSVTPALPSLFQEEQQIFMKNKAFARGQSAFALTDVALQHFTNEAMNQSQIVRTFRHQLTLSPEFQPIILALWKNQGNVSSAAKELYMHRNTLHYRIDKFYEQTSLSLKKMDDLVFCYLLIQ
ncbi:Fis family transcriptional regulator [Erwinia sp. CPCC 100877]|nr:Fis family transcriptional regulator [Erwinia sp. CPCC 100877]